MVTAVEGVDPRVKRTRKLLQQAFLELFQEKGFAAISIQDITERATANRATFYAHFQDNYALPSRFRADIPRSQHTSLAWVRRGNGMSLVARKTSPMPER